MLVNLKTREDSHVDLVLVVIEDLLAGPVHLLHSLPELAQQN